MGNLRGLKNVSYTGDLGCKVRGVPHDMKILHETKQSKWEICQICGVKKKYNKGYQGRVDNIEYLRDHVRNFAQNWGATKRIYQKIYHPENCTINI